MNCNDVELKILANESGTELPADVSEHLRTCAACRDFRKTMDMALSVGTETAPPVELDAAVLGMARERLQVRGRRPAPILDFGAYRWVWAAAAAAVVFVAVIVMNLSSPDDGGGVATRNDGVVEEGLAQEDGAVSLAWDDDDVESGLLALEAEVAFAGVAGVSQESSASGDDGTSSGSESGDSGLNSIEEAILELELDLYFEQQRWSGSVDSDA